MIIIKNDKEINIITTKSSEGYKIFNLLYNIVLFIFLL